MHQMTLREHQEQPQRGHGYILLTQPFAMETMGPLFRIDHHSSSTSNGLNFIF